MLYLLEEGDGRCVRASQPNSTKHSILSLLLNPPLAVNFIITFVMNFLQLHVGSRGSPSAWCNPTRSWEGQVGKGQVGVRMGG